MIGTRRDGWAALALLVMVVVLAACGGRSTVQSALPLGDYTATVGTQDVVAVGLPAPLPDTGGMWTLSFAAGNRYVVTKDGVAVVDGHYTATGEMLTFNDELGALACTGKTKGVYHWQLQGQELTLSVEDDTCALRRAILTAHTWAGAGVAAAASVQ